MIDLEGDAEFEASRELLWEMILDPDVLSRILPGCDSLAVVNENEYQGQMKIKIGPVDGVFRGTVALSDLQPPETFRLVVNGRGPSGVIEGEGDVRLVETPTGSTLHYEGSGQISGRMASVGQRVMSSSAKAITKQSLDNLDKQVQARTRPQTAEVEAQADVGATSETPPQEAPPAPSQTDFMLGVMENMLEEAVPDPQQRKLLIGLGAASVLLVLFNWFANLVARRVVDLLEEE